MNLECMPFNSQQSYIKRAIFDLSMKKILFVLTVVLVLADVSSVNAQVGLGRYFQGNQRSQEMDYANPVEYEIAEIKVEGVEFLDHNALISLSGLKIGDRIKVPGDAISSAIKKLWAQGIIGDIRIDIEKIEGDKAYLVIVLTERPRLSRFTIEGLNKSATSEVSDKIKLIRGRVVTDALIKNAELTVKEHFVGKGFLNTQVSVKQELDPQVQNSVHLKIQVDRGDKVRINKIDFIGNEEFDDRRLVKKMKSTNEHVRIAIIRNVFNTLTTLNGEKIRGFLGNSRDASWQELKEYINDNIKLNFFNSSKFILDDYEEDKEKVIAFLNSKGYRDAVILSDSVYRHGRNTINIDLRIDEGQKYYFRNIDWTGNFVHTDEELSAVLGVEKGDVYDMDLVNKRLNYNPTGRDVSALYMDNGYLFFNVQPVEVNIVGDSIDVEMRIYEGPQATINKILITGNDRTNDHVILREIRTLPGEKFSRADLIRTQRELSVLGYFDPEQIGINPIPNPANGTVDIEYSLVEKPSDQIELSGGWGGYYGFVGTLGLVFNNFSVRNIPNFEKWRPLPVGDGQKLALRVQANGRAYQNYSVSFSEPWLGGKKPNAFSVSFSYANNRPYANSSRFYNSYYYPYYNAAQYEELEDAQIKVYSFSVGLGRRVRWPDDFFTVSNSLTYQVYDMYKYNIGYGIGNDEGTGSVTGISLNNTIARNSLDNTLYTRSGSSISLSTSLTPPYSMFTDSNNDDYKYMEYHKWMFDASYFTTIIGDLVLNARANFGYIGSYNKETGVGPFERFWMGGSGLSGQGSFIIGREIISLRGYEDNSIVPIDNKNIQGGVIYNKFVFELRYPVSLNPSATIYVLGFAEGGNTTNSYAEYNVNKLYKSAGFGARIFMPAFGLIGVDWGYGFDRLPFSNERSGPQFHFTIGQQFR